MTSKQKTFSASVRLACPFKAGTRAAKTWTARFGDGVTTMTTTATDEADARFALMNCDVRIAEIISIKEAE